MPRLTSQTKTTHLSQKIAVIGSGAFATALAKILVDARCLNIVIYGVDAAELSDLSRGQNTKFFGPEAKLPHFNTTSDLKAAVTDAEIVILAVPSKVMDRVFDQVLTALNRKTLLIGAAKGFYPNTRLSVHQGLELKAQDSPFVRGVVSLIGPSFAQEMVQEKPTAVAAISEQLSLAKEVQALFNNDYFRVYTQTDVKGAMACAIFKNVLALASGMASVLINAHNSTAALLTRGLREMSTFVTLQGGSKLTVLGLAGIGDLILTATSNLSRNFSAGAQIAREGINSLNPRITVEGISALSTVYQIGQDAKVDLPIVNFLYAVIISQTMTPHDFRTALWERPFNTD